MKVISWLIALVGILAIASAVFFGLSASSSVKVGDAVVMPNNYYGLQVTAVGEVLCLDKKSGSYLLGIAQFYEYLPKEPRSDGLVDMIIVTSNVGITESDMDKATRPEKDLEKSQENVKEFEEKVNSLKPAALFYVHVLDYNTARIGAYQSKTRPTWLENLMFWRPRFQKEWQLIYSETYNYNRAQEVGNLALEKIYGMKCQVGIR